MVTTANGSTFVVKDRYEAMNLVRQEGGTWQERQPMDTTPYTQYPKP